jgi:surfeit locus 1 family protein
MQPHSIKKQVLLYGLAAIVAVGLTGLGFWQLGRAAQKRTLFSQVQDAHAQHALSLNGVTPEQAPGLAWQTVTLRGHYDSHEQLLWQNRFYHHRLGVEVLTPFYLQDHAGIVMVNRGWTPLDQQDDMLIKDGPHELKGVVVLPSKGLLLGPNVTGKAWPKDLQAWVWQDVQPLYREKIWPVVVRLAANQPHGFTRDWPLWTMSPERHQGYAVQWFALALTWVLGIICYQRRKQRDE